jgi:RNA polymerase sigma-70 factor (ECF subfamily)
LNVSSAKKLLDQQAGSPNAFPTTRWTLVAQAAAQSPSLQAFKQQALEELCRTYWPPIFAFIRSKGASVEEAEDLTQGFFADFLRKDDFAKPERERGKLRTFLLRSVSNYMATDWRNQNRLKRGGGIEFVSMELLADRQAGRLLEPHDSVTPEKLFLRQWALIVLDQVLTALRKRYQSEGKGNLFEALRFVVNPGQEKTSYAKVAEQLDSSEESLRVAAHRMRTRYRVLLRAAIAETLLEGENIEDEIRVLMTSFA